MLTVRLYGFEELKSRLNAVGAKQLPYATALALTKTGKQVESAIQNNMSVAFKSASPYVKRATFSTYATKTNLSTIVGLKDIKPSGGTAPDVLLREHFTGGLRGNKPYEKALISMGVMPLGYRAIAGAGMKKDAYGNPNRKEVGEILGALRSGFQVYKGRGKKITLTGYFVVQVNARSHLVPGIYKRIGREAIAMMFIFVHQASYHKVIDLQRTANQIVNNEFQRNFDASFAEALRTAR